MDNNKLKPSNISTEKLSNYIFETLESKVKGTSHEILISYSCKLDFSLNDLEICGLSKLFEKSFYLEKPEDEFFLFGLGSLISISDSGISRFSLTGKKAKIINENFICNWADNNLTNVPLFMGGMKFSSEKENELWEDYTDSLWFIPKIQLLKKGKDSFLLYNFYLSASSSVEKIIEDFNKKISTVFCFENQSDEHQKIHVVNTIGNSPKDKKKWNNTVKEIIELIEKGTYEKVVLSRLIELNLSSEPELTPLLTQLSNKYPDCYLFSFHSGKSTFFGASPEKLVKFTNSSLETDALAGSAQRGVNEIEDKKLENELLSSKKNLLEHNMVINYLKNQLSDFAEEIHVSSSPNVKKLLNIQHLWTPIKVKLRTKRQIFTILENLHPTPAVCGIPKPETINYIKKIEEYPRGLYTGILGWFNFEGEGEFFVPLRSALLKKKKLYAFAGSGIVEGSDPSTEFKETELKFKPILSLFTNED